MELRNSHNLRPSLEGCTYQEISLALNAEPFSIIICENLSCQQSLYTIASKEHFSKIALQRFESVFQESFRSTCSTLPRTLGVLSWWMSVSQHTHIIWAFSGVSWVRAESVSFWGQPARSRCRQETLAFSRRGAWLEKICETLLIIRMHILSGVRGTHKWVPFWLGPHFFIAVHIPLLDWSRKWSYDVDYCNELVSAAADRTQLGHSPFPKRM